MKKVEKVDWKFKIIAVNPCKPGTKLLLYMITTVQNIAELFKLNACTEKDCFLFKAKDVYAVDALEGYSKAMEAGVKGEVGLAQRSSAKYLRNRVESFQAKNGASTPGIETSCETARCINGLGV